MSPPRLDGVDTGKEEIEVRAQALFGDLLELSYDNLTFCRRTAADFAGRHIAERDTNTLVDPRRALTTAVMLYLKSSLAIRCEFDDGSGVRLHHTANRLPMFRLLKRYVIPIFMKAAHLLEIDFGWSTSNTLYELDQVMTARFEQILAAANDKFGIPIHHTRLQAHWLLNLTHQASCEQEERRLSRNSHIINPLTLSLYDPSFADLPQLLLPAKLLIAARFDLPNNCKQIYHLTISAAGKIMILCSIAYNSWHKFKGERTVHRARMGILSLLDLRTSLANECVGNQTPWSMFLNFICTHNSGFYTTADRDLYKCIIDEAEYWLSCGADTSLRLWVLFEDDRAAILANTSCLDIVCTNQLTDLGSLVNRDIGDGFISLASRYSRGEPGLESPLEYERVLHLCFTNEDHPLIDVFRRKPLYPRITGAYPVACECEGKPDHNI